jgi:hypothetical protein
MPSGVYDRTIKKAICDYCGEVQSLTDRGWKGHITAHIQKGHHKKGQPNGNANHVVNDLSCPECKMAGTEKTFKNMTLRNRHRSQVHKIRGPHYKYQKNRLKRTAIVHVKKGETNGTNGATQVDIQHEQDEERLAFYVAGHTARTLEVFAASANQPSALLTARVCSILQIGNNPVRKELRRQG